MVASGIAVGLNKGHLTTKREQPQRPSQTKGVSAGWHCEWRGPLSSPGGPP
jgi:hypothetical protein